MQYLDHLHPSVLKEWAQEMKDAAERIFNKSINSKAEKNPSIAPIFKRVKSNQEYVKSINLIKSMLLRIIILSCKIQSQRRKQMIIKEDNTLVHQR